MATLNSTYYVPSEIRWVDGLKTVDSASISRESEAVVESGGISRKLCWTCSHSNFQYQYRIRRRYSPPYAAAMGLSSDGEVWEDWGAWLGTDISKDERSAAERMAHVSNTTITTDAFMFAYDFSQFDKLEYQVRARAFNPFTFECSEWGYETLSVSYRPTARFSSSGRQDGGDVLLSVDTNWQRGGNRFYMKNIRPSKNGATSEVIKGAAVSASGLEPDYSVTIPARYVKTADKVYADFYSYTSDGVSAKFEADYFNVKEKTPTGTISAPSVNFSDRDKETIVKVSPNGSKYDSVFVTASYRDALGREVLIEADSVSSQLESWTATFDAPPYDVTVTYRVSVSNSDGWIATEAEHVTRSKGRCTWSSESDFVSLELDIEAASSYSPNVETYQTTRGTDVARFGLGGSRSLTLHGKLLADDGAWRPALEALRKPSAWVYRKPGGERYKVVVTAISESESKETTGRVISASVYMTEVE